MEDAPFTKQPDADAGTFPLADLSPQGIEQRFNLESSVGRGGVCVCGGAGQGATTRNSHCKELQRSHVPPQACNPPCSGPTQQVNPLE